jgi:hypothetical protein
MTTQRTAVPLRVRQLEKRFILIRGGRFLLLQRLYQILFNSTAHFVFPELKGVLFN